MDKLAVRVLIVDDNPGDARLVEWALTHETEGAFRCSKAGRISAALERLDAGGVDAVLLDLGLPDSRGMDGLARIRQKAPDVPVVVLTGSEDPVLIRQAITAGAQDYQVKGIFPRGHLSRVLHSAIHRQQVEGCVRRGEAPAESTLLRLGQLGEGVAVYAGSNLRVANAAYGQLIGTGPEGATGFPSWLGRVAPPSATPSSHTGEVGLERPDGRRVEVEYVVRRFPDYIAPQVMVRLREVLSRPAEGSALGGRPAEPSTLIPGGAADGSSPTGGAPLDEAAWAQLRELAGQDATFLRSLIDSFLEEAGRLVHRLEVAADRGDGVVLTQTAHSLKSSCAQVGALSLSRQCADLERQGRVAELAEMRTTVRGIAREFPAVAEALRARRAPA